MSREVDPNSTSEPLFDLGWYDEDIIDDVAPPALDEELQENLVEILGYNPVKEWRKRHGDNVLPPEKLGRSATKHACRLLVEELNAANSTKKLEEEE